MTINKNLILKNLLRKVPDNERLVKFLTPDAIESLQKAEDPAEDIHHSVKNTSLLYYVHYSWFEDIIDSPYLLSSLPIKIANQVSKLISIPYQSDLLTKAGQHFFLEKIINKLTSNKSVLPIEFLPKSDLINLLSFSKNSLVSIIDYLSLYDLSNEIRKTIESKTIKKYYNLLPAKQKLFFKNILHHKETFMLPSLSLSANIDDIKKTLHKRGLVRLALVLSKENDSVIWYIIHKLDIGRGKIVQKLINKNIKQSISDIVKNQIFEIISFINEG
jgi:hypothetical protein